MMEKPPRLPGPDQTSERLESSNREERLQVVCEMHDEAIEALLDLDIMLSRHGEAEWPPEVARLQKVVRQYHRIALRHAKLTEDDFLRYHSGKGSEPVQ